MTKRQIAASLIGRNLHHEERRLGNGKLEIEVFAPDGHHFIDGPHSFVFHWQNGSISNLRATVVQELSSEVNYTTKLAKCTSECDD